VPKTNSNASASTGMVLIEISFFILVFIEIFSFFVRIFTKQKLTFKNTYIPITQLPDILLTSPGKPCHLPHWHYLLTDLKALTPK
jgi:hypothetical protein